MLFVELVRWYFVGVRSQPLSVLILGPLGRVSGIGQVLRLSVPAQDHQIILQLVTVCVGLGGTWERML